MAEILGETKNEMTDKFVSMTDSRRKSMEQEGPRPGHDMVFVESGDHRAGDGTSKQSD